MLVSSDTPHPSGSIPPINLAQVHYEGEWTGDPSGEIAILTKGDNNQVDDRGLYLNRQLFISRREIMGRAYAVLPYVAESGYGAERRC